MFIKRILSLHGLLLTTIVVMAFKAVDRQILNILLEDIKQELLLTDSQLGLLAGFAFVLVYVVMGVPAAYIADRTNRVRLLSIALTFWSIMTVFCGTAQNYFQILMARMGVGMGESASVPTMHSMIADRYPPKYRATALSINSSGFFIGVFLGFAGGGWVADQFGWRMAFIAVGLPGILAAVLIWIFLKDPPQLKVEGQAEDVEIGFVESLTYLWKIRAFRWYVPGISLKTIAYAGLLTWMPVFLIREYGMSKTEIGAIMGLVTGIGGLGATIVTGIIADRLGERDRRWNLGLVALFFLVSAPLVAGAFLIHAPFWNIVLYASAILLLSGVTSPVISATQQIAPPRLKAMVSAMTFLVFNVIGYGLGPLLIGMASDWLTPEYGEATALRIVLFGLSSLLIISALIVLVGIRHFPAESNKAGELKVA